MPYSHILPGFHFERHHRCYYHLLKEVIFLSRIGFKGNKPRKIIQSRKRIAEFIIDETLIKAGNEYVWLLWIAVKSANKTVLEIRISFEMNILIAEQFIQHLSTFN